MRLPRVRYTLRSMLVAVAVVAMTLGVSVELGRRRMRFSRLAAYHRARIVAPSQYVDKNRRIVRWVGRDSRFFEERPRLDYWHEELAMKYDAAASRPWYPVEPDPPPPRPGEPLSVVNKKMWPDPFPISPGAASGMP